MPSITANYAGDDSVLRLLARQEAARDERRVGVRPGGVVDDDGVGHVALVERQDLRLRLGHVGQHLRGGGRWPTTPPRLPSAVTAEAIAASATESMNLTFWLTSFVMAPGDRVHQLPLDGLVGHLGVLAPLDRLRDRKRRPVGAVVSGYSEPGATARGLSVVKMDSPVS
jgi:hypothetical protein